MNKLPRHGGPADLTAAPRRVLLQKIGNHDNSGGAADLLAGHPLVIDYNIGLYREVARRKSLLQESHRKSH